MLMALSWSFQQLINDQTQHKEPLSQIQTCNSVPWAVTQCSLHLGRRWERKTRLWYWRQMFLGRLDRGNHSRILLLLWWQAQICFPQTRNEWKPVGKIYTLCCARLPVIYMKSSPRHLFLQPLGKGSSFPRASLFRRQLLSTYYAQINASGSRGTQSWWNSCLLKEFNIYWRRQMGKPLTKL